jgi:hypothetical protein
VFDWMERETNARSPVGVICLLGVVVTTMATLRILDNPGI